MKKLITSILVATVCAILPVRAQITSTTAMCSGITNYSLSTAVDSIFYYCGSGSLGSLTATPPSGTPNWTFTWQSYDPGTNAWVPFSVTNNAVSSTLTNLNPGGYRVTIVDGGGNTVGCYRAWIVDILSPNTVDVAPIPPGCGSVQLNGTITWGSGTPYYELPPEPMPITATTEINVCFRATHTYVSDLGFYLVGPASCGSPVVTLSPNPGSIGQNNICNSGNDVGNVTTPLCFTTNAAPNLDVCAASTPLVGTYDSYGPAATPIDWTPIYGCDASNPGWRVQIYDCISLDVGALTYASISFTGVTACGDTATFTYDSGTISSPINDNSCTPATASIYTVPPTPAIVANYDTTFEWTANPNITIPNATTSLTPLVNPGPTQNTDFTLTVNPGAFGGSSGCCGGNNSDTEPYIYIPPVPANLLGQINWCTTDSPGNLISDVPGGVWTGPGITDPVNGTFDPSLAGAGVHNITYMVNNPCPVMSVITLNVTTGVVATIDPVAPLCEGDPTIDLIGTPAGGSFSGTGITNSVTGTFDPSVAGPGDHVITYTITGGCGGGGTTTVTVIPQSGNPPSASLFNTASNGSGGVLPGGSNDLNWTVSTNLAGPYSPAVVMTPTPASYYTSPWSDADWIAHVIDGSHSGNVDYYYRIFVDLPCFNNCGQSYGDSAVFCLTMDFFCDNSVNEIYVNGVAQSPTQPLIPVANQYSNIGFNAAGGLTVTLCSDWQPGRNELIVKVSSGGPFEGFLAQYSTSSVGNQDDPTISVPNNDTTFCVNDPITTLTAASTGGTWSADCGTCIDPVTGAFDPSAAGVGTFWVGYATSGLCPNLDSIQVVVNPLPVLDAGSAVSLCVGDSVQLNATGADTYVWTPNQNISSTSVADPFVFPTTTTSYVVSGTDANGCSTTDSVLVTANVAGSLIFSGSTVVCEGDCSQITINGATNLQWSTTVGVADPNNTTTDICPTVNTSYTVSGVDANGCPVSNTLNMTVSLVNAQMVVNPISGTNPLTVTASNSSSAPATYIWNFGNGTGDTTTTLIDVTGTYPVPGNYTLTLTVVDANGCTDQVTQLIQVLPGCMYMIPNVFSPNGDGKNEVFELVCPESMKTMTMKIFNRWGQEVATVEGVGNHWDGGDQKEGVYYYVITGELLDGTAVNESGFVTLTR